MKRRACLRLCLGPIGGLWCVAALADPSPAERMRIDKLIAAVGQRSDITFVRNGKEYSCTQAAEFLRGKFKWRSEKVATAQDFIEQIGTRSTSSGDMYHVRLADGRLLPSAEFLKQELRRIERR